MNGGIEREWAKDRNEWSEKIKNWAFFVRFIKAKLFIKFQMYVMSITCEERNQNVDSSLFGKMKWNERNKKVSRLIMEAIWKREQGTSAKTSNIAVVYVALWQFALMLNVICTVITSKMVITRVNEFEHIKRNVSFEASKNERRPINDRPLW